jgi:hypothetical protein
MTVLMACLKCDIMVINPKIMNYMLEMCDACVLNHNELSNQAIDTYLHEKAEAQRDAQFKNHSPAR